MSGDLSQSAAILRNVSVRASNLPIRFSPRTRRPVPGVAGSDSVGVYWPTIGTLMTRKVIVAGVGMIPFVKPSAAESYLQMGAKAVRLALRDAAVPYEKIQQVYAGYV